MVAKWSFHLRVVLISTRSSLKEETHSTANRLYASGKHDSLNFAGATTISLLFFPVKVARGVIVTMAHVFDGEYQRL